MTRVAAGFEGLDDEHGAAAAGARVCERLHRIGLVRVLSFCRSIGRGWGDVQELTHVLDRFGAIVAGEQAVVAVAAQSSGAWLCPGDSGSGFVTYENGRAIVCRIASMEPVVGD